MALAPIAPWLQPADALGAARGGAALGLQQREQNISRLNAIERTALAYAQLNAESQREAARNDARMELAAMNLEAKQRIAEAADALRRQQFEQQQQQFEARNQLGQANLDARLAQLGLSSQVAQSNQELAAQRLLSQQERLAQTTRYENAMLDQATQNRALREEIWKSQPRRMTDSEKMVENMLQEQLKGALSAVAKEWDPMLKQKLMEPVQQITAKLEALRQGIMERETTKNPLPLPEVATPPSEAMPRGPKPAKTEGGVWSVKTQADYEALDPGDVYLNENTGQYATKPF